MENKPKPTQKSDPVDDTDPKYPPPRLDRFTWDMSDLVRQTPAKPETEK
jgi:hypothetical protein